MSDLANIPVPPKTGSRAIKIAGAIFGLILILTVFNPFVTIGPGQRGVVVQLGAVKPVVLEEGLHFRIPLIQTIVELNCQIQKTEVQADAASKDLQQVTSHIAVNYHVKYDMAAKLYQSVGENYGSTIIDPAIQETVKSVTARYTAEELITKRQQVSVEIGKYLDEKLEPRGILVDAFNITNFSFSDEFNRAIEAKQTAEQLALKAKRDLERIRVEAEQKVAQAKAEAEALRVQKQEVTPELIRLREIEVQSKAIEKWDGHMPQYTGGAMPFLDISRVQGQ
ncbi:MAG: prohibitin family protein [Candidatus Saccharibacteria bacterium]